MDETDTLTLDLEYKRYLQILRPYLSQLIEQSVITLCNAWIQRLSNCSDDEKVLRNKYIFSLCYQIAKGALEEPFLKYPGAGSLSPLSESLASESSTEVECYVVNADETNTEVLYSGHNTPPANTEYRSRTDCQSQDRSRDSLKTSRDTIKPIYPIMCHNCPEMFKDFMNCDQNDAYEYRANNLIKKLRDIKTQNMMLHNELMTIKEQSTINNNKSFSEEDKIDRATSAMLQSNESNSTLKSLRCQLQEAQVSRNTLIEKIASLQEQLDNFNDMKQHEIENIEANHKLEIINIKSTTREEIKSIYEKKLQDLKEESDLKINTILNKSSQDIQILSTTKDDMIQEKNRLISAKDNEISQLNVQIEDLKNHLHAVLEKFIDKPTPNYNGEESLKFKAEQLEKRLSRVEKNKVKSTRVYEAKVAQLQREKHLAECSLQLQMVRQRAQVVNEVTDENQSELTSALDKLETKYKEIVANVQATAIQRRMQDQMALESILQAACGIPNENNNPPGTNGQFPKTMRNQNRSNDGGTALLSRANKVGNICIGNKSFGEDSLTGYCLNGERMGELFERVYIPQRDNPDTIK